MTSRTTEEATGPGVRPDGPGAGPAGPARRVLWLALLELFALTGLAIAQPLLDVTGKAPDFFLFHRADRTEILLLVAAIVALPAIGLWLLEVAARLLAGERLRRLLHLALLTGLLCVLALEVGKKLLPIRGKRLLLAAVLAGLLVGLLYQRWPALKLWLRYLAPAPLVFALVFVTMSPTAALILPSRSASGTVPVQTRPGSPLPPVVMILFDEFPLESLLDSRGQIDRRVYPNLATFASGATWYRNATGISGWTPYALPAMLDGRWPAKNQAGAVPNAGDYPDNLFTMFGRHYNLKVFETITQLCPTDRCGQTGTRSGFGTVAKETAKLYRNIISPVDVAADAASVGQDPTLKPTDKGPTAYFGNLKFDQVRRVDQFASSINAGDPQPSLYFLHLLLPHTPWKYLPDGRVYNSGSLPNAAVNQDQWPPAVQQLNRKRHLLQLAYTDTVIGRVIDRLKQQGLWDKSLVVMTADHGEGFTPGSGTRRLGPKNADDLLWVPMFVKRPGQTEGRVDDRNWEHVDLLPTVADIVGLTIPWKVDGVSQAGPPGREATDKTFYNEPGQPLTRPGPPYFRQVLQGVTDTVIKAHQNGERGFYQFGDTSDWIYRSPQELGQVGGPTVTAKLRDWDLFDTVDPKASAVPLLLVGDLTSGTPPPGATMVAVVNGQIAATGGFFAMEPDDPVVTFGAMTPDFLYKPGPGHPQIQLYLATKAGPGWRFQPVTISGRR